MKNFMKKYKLRNQSLRDIYNRRMRMSTKKMLDTLCTAVEKGIYSTPIKYWQFEMSKKFSTRKNVLILFDNVVINEWMKENYPCCWKHDIKILRSEKGGFCYCPGKELDKRLNKLRIKKLFTKLYGIQTACESGPYASDTEAVMQRIFNKKLVGSQLIWD